MYDVFFSEVEVFMDLQQQMVIGILYRGFPEIQLIDSGERTPSVKKSREFSHY